MSGFDENIVREYFELNGFLVRHASKTSVAPKKRSVSQLEDFEIFNPGVSGEPTPLKFQLFANDVPSLQKAFVVTKGWHASRFTPAILKSNAKTFDFIKRDIIGKSETFFEHDEAPVQKTLSRASTKRILILPHLPTADPYRADSIALLKGCDVDHVITYTTILENLLRLIDVNPSYQRSEVLQLIRILKIYDMIQVPQMQFFSN